MKTINYFPGLIILVFGMLALYSTVRVTDAHKHMVVNFIQKSIYAKEIKEGYDSFENAFFSFSETPSHESYKVLSYKFDKFFQNYYALRDQITNDADNNDYLHHSTAFLEMDQYLLSLAKYMREVQKNDYQVSHQSKGEEALQQVQGHIKYLLQYWGDEKELEALKKDMKQEEDLHYWSIIAVSFAGFLMVLLNANKLRRLKLYNQEKREVLKLLEDRVVAMESTFEGIGIVNSDGILTYMNWALKRLHGIYEEDVDRYIGHHWTGLYSLQEKENIEEKVMPKLLKTGFWQGETKVEDQFGEFIPVSLSLRMLPDGGIIGTARDLSQERQAQDEKEKLQAQFYQSQKMEAVGRVAGGIAHDFNNILASINGYAEFLMEDLEEETPQHKFASNILQAGMQARRLIEKIMTFSRRDEGVFTPFDLSDPVQETIMMMESSLSKNIAFDTKINALHAPVYGISGQLAQVLMNLCVNARDAIGDDNGTISLGLDIVAADPVLIRDLPEGDEEHTAMRIEAIEDGYTGMYMGTLDANKKYVCINVGDTGCGIDQSILEHVFEPFFTTKPVNKGTGLGLSAVHGVVLAHKGGLVLETKVGEGSVFKLYFPYYEDAEIRNVVEDTVDIASLQAYILLVEDQPEVADVATRMLTRIGAQVEHAENGQVALEMIADREGDYDLVITDQNMPVMNGLELVEEACQAYPDLYFIVLSGYSKKELRKLMYEHQSIKAVLGKPISKKELSHHIKIILEEKRASELRESA